MILELLILWRLFEDDKPPTRAYSKKITNMNDWQDGIDEFYHK